MTTGWFGEAGTGKSTKVHFVKHGATRPICGASIGKRMEFQWCANWFEYSYVECLTCRRIARLMARKS